MKVFLVGMTPEALEEILYPILPASLVFLLLMVLSVIIKMAIRNKFGTHR
ncbi:MAG TPA: hypothetical protein VIK80_02440 [Flavihumibacter sp.]|jgi:hypothetical protein